MRVQYFITYFIEYSILAVTDKLDKLHRRWMEKLHYIIYYTKFMYLIDCDKFHTQKHRYEMKT